MFEQQVTFIYCQDLAQSRTFYEGQLGLRLALDQGGCRIYSVGRDAFLGVCQVREGRSIEPTGVVVTFVTEDVDGCYERLLTAGVQFDDPPRVHPEFRIYHCFFRDPDGYLLEIQRFDNPAWPKAQNSN